MVSERNARHLSTDTMASSTEGFSFIQDVLYNPILSGIIGTLIVSVLAAVMRKHRETKYRHLLGSYFGYHFLRDEITLVPLAVEFKLRGLGDIHVSTKELNQAAYAYEGQVTVLSDIAYARLTGKASDDLLFMVLQLPFNKSSQLPALNGIYVGSTQAKEPAATKIVLSRTPLSEEAIRDDLGSKPWCVFSDNWPEATHILKASRGSKLR